VSLLEQMSELVRELLREDRRRLLVGEDVREGGLWGLSRAAALDEGLADRLISTPLAPTVAVAHAAGLALSGARPILVLPSASALLEGLCGLREAAQVRWRSGDHRKVPLLIVAPVGPGFGLGGEAAESPEGILVRIPGLHVVAAGRAEELGALIRAAVVAVEDPTVLLLPRTLLLQDIEAPVEDLGRPLFSSCRRRTGAAATVFAWGATVDLALAAADRTELGVTVVDVGSLAPLDADGLLAAASETGRLVIVHGGPRAHGVGAELSAIFADAAILRLEAPILRVCGADGHPTPSGEPAVLPTIDAVAEAIAHVAHY
jgi:pyruvate/2-oxoglutarate/acetoin dehydrogenase E1 component